MAKKKVSFKAGTKARAARGKVAESLKARGVDPDIAFAEATNIIKRASPGGRKRLARKGLKKTKRA